MQEYWGIQYKITFGTEDKIVPSVIPAAIAISGANERYDRVVLPTNALSKDNVDDPRGFTFEYEAKTGLSVDGVATDNYTLTLYNLNDEELTVLNQSEAIVQVELGWKSLDTLKLEFYGNVFDIQTQTNAPDTLYNIIDYPSGNTLHSTMFNESVSSGNTTTITAVFSYIAKKLGIGFTTPNLSRLDAINKETWYLKGAAFNVIKWFCEKYELVWTISNGKLIVADGLYKTKTSTTVRHTLHDNNIKYISNARQKKFGSNDYADKLKEINVGVFYDNYDLGDVVNITTENENDCGTYLLIAKRVIAQSKGNGWDCVLNLVEIDQ